MLRNRTSAKGVRFIAAFEGLRLKAYRDAVGVWTIGYGHTGPDVHPGLTITKARATQLLQADLRRFEKAVVKSVPWRWRRRQHRFDALVSIAYNLGPEVLTAAPPLTSLGVALKRRPVTKGNLAKVGAAMRLYCYAGGEALPGLVRRRRAEARLFMDSTPSYSVE